MEYRDVQSRQTSLDVKLIASKDLNGNHWYLHNNSNSLRSFITTITASQIHKHYQSKRTALFNLNIRNFIGDTSTNKGILKTVEEESQNFFFYNNGISAIASKVIEDHSTGTLDCKNFSIINGAQTFRSISRAYSRLDGKSKDSIKTLAVMLRLTEAPNLFTETELVERITQYNNTQNAIKISDFRSNDGVQTSLANYFARISFDGKKYYYKNKRTKETPRNSIVISLDDFCKTIHSFDKGPVDCYGGIKYLYETNPSGGYYFLFGDKDSNQILTTLSEEKLQTMAAKYFICETARTFFDNEKKQRIEKEEMNRSDENTTPIISKRALEGRYFIFFTLGVILTDFTHSKNISLDQFVKSENFHNPNWRKDNRKTQLIKEVVSVSCDVLVQDYQYSSRNRDFVHRNWFREQDTLERLRTSIITVHYSNLKRIYEAYG